MNNPIYPCLWFDGKAKEAATFYCSVFKNSGITSDTPLVVTFKSPGQDFMCLNGGGPQFMPYPSISFYVVCETKEEVERAWAPLIEGGQAIMPLDRYDRSEKYGWVQDRYGISWQLTFGRIPDVGRKFSPLLMFTGEKAGKAEEAIRFYTSLFKPSSIVGIMKYEKGEPDVEGTVKHTRFKLGGQAFMAMDSSRSHAFDFNEAISLVVECDTQEEIDRYWDRLTSEGEASMCGWLKDRY